VRETQLVVWNDLELCGYCANTGELEDFLVGCRTNVRHYELLGPPDTAEWITRAKRGSAPRLLVGTRPAALGLAGFQISTTRHHGRDGETAHVAFSSSQDLQRLRYAVQAAGEGELHLVEDVVVTGHTAALLVSACRDAGFSGQLSCDVLCASEQAVAALGNVGLEVRSSLWMKGPPLRGCTLLCLSDLLFGQLGDRPYLARRDLLARFLFEKVDAFITLASRLREEARAR
jgi:hypothetical protein